MTASPHFPHLPDPGPFVCPECAHTCAWPGALIRHLENVHGAYDVDEALILKGATARRLSHLRADYPAHASWTLDTYPTDELARQARDAALEWYDHLELPNLSLYGPVGSAKTGLAWSLLVRFLEEDGDLDSTFVNLRQHFSLVRRCLTMGLKVDPLDGLNPTGLLVLDDLGAERGSAYELDLIATIVEARHLGELPTIATSNYTPDELIQRWSKVDDVTGQRIVSRLVSRAVQVHVRGGDRRMKDAA